MSMTSSLLLRPDLTSKIHPEQPEQEQDFTFLGINHFDRLPDSLLLLVFNKIGDVKALGRCCVVSRRFHYLVPQVDNVVVRVDCVISDDDSSSSVIILRLFHLPLTNLVTLFRISSALFSVDLLNLSRSFLNSSARRDHLVRLMDPPPCCSAKTARSNEAA
ncbi:F-box protein At5g46170-like [Fagus crenata]